VFVFLLGASNARRTEGGQNRTQDKLRDDSQS